MDELERSKSSKTRSLRGDLRCDLEAQGASSLGSKGVASTWPNARCDSSCIISCCSRALERWERSGLRGTLNRHGATHDRQMRGRRATLRHQAPDDRDQPPFDPFPGGAGGFTAHCAALFCTKPSLPLPAWPVGWCEVLAHDPLPARPRGGVCACGKPLLGCRTPFPGTCCGC